MMKVRTLLKEVNDFRLQLEEDFGPLDLSKYIEINEERFISCFIDVPVVDLYSALMDIFEESMYMGYTLPVRICCQRKLTYPLLILS